MTSKFSRNFTYRKCKGIIGEAVENEESYVISESSKGIHISW